MLALASVRAEARGEDNGARDRIARLHWAPERTRDTMANYNPKTRAQLIAFAPGLHWQAMLDAMAIGTWDSYSANTPTALQGIASLVTSQPLEDWKAYLTYHHLHNHASFLNQAIDDENFAFHGKVLAGREASASGGSAASTWSDRLGEAIGQVYVQRHFPPESKAEIDALVENLRRPTKPTSSRGRGWVPRPGQGTREARGVPREIG